MTTPRRKGTAVPSATGTSRPPPLDFSPSSTGHSTTGGRPVSHDHLPSTKQRQSTTAGLPHPATATTTAAAAAAAPVQSIFDGSTGLTGADLLAGFGARRKMLGRASNLARLMREQTQEVMEMEEQNRLLHFSETLSTKTGGVGAGGDATTSPGGATDQKAMEKGRRSSSRGSQSGGRGRSSSGAKSSGDDESEDGGLYTSESIGFDSAANEKMNIRDEIQQKTEKLTKMRDIQRAIRELDEGEERAKVMSTIPKQLYSSPIRSPTTGSLEKESEHSMSPTSQQQHPGKKPAATMTELRIMLNGLIDGRAVHRSATDGSEEERVELPMPPGIFSSNAFALTLEYLSEAFSNIMLCADELCMTTTFRSRDERIDPVPHLSALSTWLEQAKRCIDTSMQHLKHFETGEAAVLDGAEFEVNSLREQTLQLKETLTAQDQKRRSKEETLNTIIYRLRETNRRCVMLDEYVLHQPSANSLNAFARFFSSPRPGSGAATAQSDLSSVEQVADGRAVDRSSSVVPFFSAADGRAARVSTAATHKPEERRVSRALSFRSHIGTPTTAQVRDFLPNSRLSSASDASKDPPTWGSLPCIPKIVEPDMLEWRVSNTWGNPYIKRQMLRYVTDSKLRCDLLRSGINYEGNTMSMSGIGSPPGGLAGREIRRASMGLDSGSPTNQDAKGNSGNERHFSNVVSSLDAFCRPGSKHSPATPERDVERASDDFTPSATMNSADTGEDYSLDLNAVPIKEVADMRTVQLLQSLLRSISTSSTYPYNDGPSITASVIGLDDTLSAGDEVSEELLHQSQESIARLLKYLSRTVETRTPVTAMGAPPSA